MYGPSVARRVRAFFTARPVTGAAKPFPELTEHEREVLDLIASGASNTDIARRLFVSDKTVRNHVTNIFAKTHVADRSEAIVQAREAGLGGSLMPFGDHRCHERASGSGAADCPEEG